MRYALLATLLFGPTALVLTIPSTTQAETCASSTYTKVLPAKIKFGMSRAQVKRARRLTKIAEKDNNVIYKVKDAVGPYGFITVRYLNDKAIRVLATYRVETITSLGGPTSAIKQIAPKFVKEFGASGDVKERGEGAQIGWPDNGGATLFFMADPASVQVRVDCDALESSISAKAAAGLELGF